MATVMQAYSKGRAIFDHSFEGYNTPADNQRQFLRINTIKLRELVAADIANGVAGINSRVMVSAPKAGATPSPFVISRGSLPAGVGLTTAGAEGGPSRGSVTFPINYPDVEGTATMAEIAQAAIDNGSVNLDDYYTVCMFVCDPTDLPVFEITGANPPSTKQWRTEFLFVRLRFRSDLLTDTESRSAGYFSQLNSWFEVDLTSGGLANVVSANIMADTTTLTTPISVNFTGPGNESNYTGFVGVIRSRFNEGLRSNAEMVYGGPYNTASQFGITAPNLIKAWTQGTPSVGDSSKILEGGGN